MVAESSQVPKCSLKAVELIKQLNGSIINRKSSDRKSPSLLQWGNGHQCGGKYLKKCLLGDRFCHHGNLQTKQYSYEHPQWVPRHSFLFFVGDQSQMFFRLSRNYLYFLLLRSFVSLLYFS